MEYFALKNGILYWYPHERARKAKGQIIVRNIDALEINPKNKLEITLLYQKKMYRLQSLDTAQYALKWFNSIKMVKELGDIHNLDPDRYMKLNVYQRENARVVFRDFEYLLTAYETKICKKIYTYKYHKIFYHEDMPEDAIKKDAPKKSAAVRASKILAAGEEAKVAGEQAGPGSIKPKQVLSQMSSNMNQVIDSANEENSCTEDEAASKKKGGKLGRLKAFYLNKKKEMKINKQKKLDEKDGAVTADASTNDDLFSGRHSSIPTADQSSLTIPSSK